ncbi:MAG: OsmC family protein [Pseudohongiellaceae bacterium]
MSLYIATINWTNSGPDFLANKYSREHHWLFDGGVTVPASASPQIVPEPWSVLAHVDPEEAFVASLSSCHMLFFLSIAAKRGYVVESYRDEAQGIMDKNAEGKMVMTIVTLNPHTRFSGDRIPDQQTLEKIHHHAHDLCFIANSVLTTIDVIPVLVTG